MKLKLGRSRSVALTRGADVENLDGVAGVVAEVVAAATLTRLSRELQAAGRPRQLLAHEGPEQHRE